MDAQPTDEMRDIALWENDAFDLERKVQPALFAGLRGVAAADTQGNLVITKIVGESKTEELIILPAPKEYPSHQNRMVVVRKDGVEIVDFHGDPSGAEQIARKAYSTKTMIADLKQAGLATSINSANQTAEEKVHTTEKASVSIGHLLHSRATVLAKRPAVVANTFLNSVSVEINPENASRNPPTVEPHGNVRANILIRNLSTVAPPKPIPVLTF